MFKVALHCTNATRVTTHSPSNRGCFINIPLPKAYYMSFCSENVLYEEPPVSSVAILGFGRYASTNITILRKPLSPRESVHILQTSLVIWVVEYHLLDPYDQWIIHAEHHNFGVILNPGAPCGLRGCKNRAHSVSWPEVVKGVPNHSNQDVDCFVSYGSFFLFFFCVCGVGLCSVVFYCFWLSVPVQSIVWKDSSPKWLIICRVGR